jgi:hypothetical protein
VGLFVFWLLTPKQMALGECRSDPLAGVYFPSRLHVVNPCITVSGTVDCLKQEPDGDVHIRLRLDPQFAYLLTSANSVQVCTDQTGPHLVVEIIPNKPEGLLFRDNAASKGGFVDPPTPRAGDHIKVTGPYVLDDNQLHNILYFGKSAANWGEIHPAWAIVVDRPGPGSVPNNPGVAPGD